MGTVQARVQQNGLWTKLYGIRHDIGALQTGIQKYILQYFSISSICEKEFVQNIFSKITVLQHLFLSDEKKKVSLPSRPTDLSS